MEEDIITYLTDLYLSRESTNTEEDLINSTDKLFFNETLDSNIEYSHIVIDTRELLEVLKLISPIVNLKSARKVPKSLTILYEEGSFYYIITDDISYFKYKINILNKDNILEETICIPLNILQSAIKLFGKEVIIYRKDNTYYLRLTKGDFVLDLVKPEEDLLVMEGIPGKELCYIPTESLYTGLRALLPIVSDEVNIENKRVSFIKDKMFYQSGKFIIASVLGFPEMKLSFRSLTFLKKLVSMYSTALYVYRDTTNENRVFIKCDNVIYSTIVMKPDSIDLIEDFISRKIKNRSILVSYNDLFNIVSFACGLNTSSGYISFDIDSENNLDINISCLKAVSTFKILNLKKQELEGKSTTIKEPLQVLASSFKKLLGSFSGYDDLYVILNEDSIVLLSHELEGVLLK